MLITTIKMSKTRTLMESELMHITLHLAETSAKSVTRNE